MATFQPGSRRQDECFAIVVTQLAGLVADMEAVERGVRPESLVDKRALLLDRWAMARGAVPCLAGLSSGHPRLVGHGRPLFTSDLWLMAEDRSWARTLSRWYRLGRPVGESAEPEPSDSTDPMNPTI